MFRDGQLQDERPGRGLDATTLLSKFV
jgi:hypothetical protein